MLLLELDLLYQDFVPILDQLDQEGRYTDSDNPIVTWMVKVERLKRKFTEPVKYSRDNVIDSVFGSVLVIVGVGGFAYQWLNPDDSVNNTGDEQQFDFGRRSWMFRILVKL